MCVYEAEPLSLPLSLCLSLCLSLSLSLSLFLLMSYCSGRGSRAWWVLGDVRLGQYRRISPADHRSVRSFTAVWNWTGSPLIATTPGTVINTPFWLSSPHLNDLSITRLRLKVKVWNIAVINHSVCQSNGMVKGAILASCGKDGVLATVAQPAAVTHWHLHSNTHTHHLTEMRVRWMDRLTDTSTETRTLHTLPIKVHGSRVTVHKP